MIIDIIFLIITLALTPGLCLWMWETGLNFKKVPPARRPKFLGNDMLTAYLLLSCWGMIFIPLFATRYFGWYGLFAYQLYPLACIVITLVMVIVHRIVVGPPQVEE